MLQKISKRSSKQSMYTAMTTLRNRVMQLFLSFDRLINSWLSLVTISRSLMIKGERKRKKKKEEKAGRMCTSYRSDTIIEITVNDRQGEEDDVYPNLWRIHVYAGLRMHISQKFERFRVPHWNIFNRIGQMNRRDSVGINNGEIHQRFTKIVMIILSHREGTSINRC